MVTPLGWLKWCYFSYLFGVMRVCKDAEREGFEPSWEQAPHPISSRRRYDRFGTSPLSSELYLVLGRFPGISKNLNQAVQYSLAWMPLDRHDQTQDSYCGMHQMISLVVL